MTGPESAGGRGHASRRIRRSKPDGIPVADSLDDASVPAPIFHRRPTRAHSTSSVRGSTTKRSPNSDRQSPSDPLVTDRALQSDEAKPGVAAFKAEERRRRNRRSRAQHETQSGIAEVHRIHGMVFAAREAVRQEPLALRNSVPHEPAGRAIAARDRRCAARFGHGRSGARESSRTIRDFPDRPRRNGSSAGSNRPRRSGLPCNRSSAQPPGRSSPELARLYAIVGQAHHAQFNLDAAADAYRRRVRIAPNDRDAHFDLGEVYRAQDKLDEALAEYLAAALMDPARAKAFAHDRSGAGRSRP